MQLISLEWDWFIIVLSYFTAVLGGYTSLHIVSHANKSNNKYRKQLWLAFGSFTLGGCAIWSAHFVGMMAVSFPKDLPVRYNIFLTLLSLLSAVLAGRISFAFLKKPSDEEVRQLWSIINGDIESASLVGVEDKAVQPNPRNCSPVPSRKAALEVVVAGSILSLGICACHYLGMSAMRMNAIAEWNVGLVFLSMIGGFIVITISQVVNTHFQYHGQYVVASLIFGFGVCIAHYTGMTAVYYYTGADVPPIHPQPSGVNVLFDTKFAVVVSLFATFTCFVLYGIVSGTVSQLRDRLEKEVGLYKKMEQLVVQKEDAERENQAKSSFVATVSHELRTPLNIIVGATELLSSTSLTVEQQEYTGAIEKSSHNLCVIINDILDFSLLDTGHMRLENASFSPVDVVESVMYMMSLSVSQHVDLLLRVNDSAPDKVFGDSTRFQQVLLNLLSNAVKFTECGYVLVDIHTESPIAGEPFSSRLVVSVEDSGIGISPVVFEHIFEPFHQGDSTHARKYGGTGLGLSVIKRLVDLMGGDIKVGSKEGQGSVFTCSFPFNVDYTSSNVAIPAFASLRCFLLCRNSLAQTIYKSWLVSWGVLVIEGKRDEDMPYALNADNFDVIIADEEIVNSHKLTISSMTGKLKPLVLIGTHRKGGGLPTNVSFLRRPVFSKKLFSALQDILCSSAPTSAPSPALLLKSSLVLSQTSPEAPLRPTLGNNMPEHTSSSEPTRVLLVDDNTLNQQVGKRILERMGAVVQVADNGSDALDIIERNTFDVVFMDCQMPVMDGFDATRRLRQREQEMGLNRLRVIALTAGVSEQLREECAQCGMDGFVAKPATAKDFKRALVCE